MEDNLTPQTETTMKKVTDLKENEVIHCSTKKEAKAICKLMHKAGLRWCNGDKYKVGINWRSYRQETCYQPAEGLFCYRGYYEEIGFIVHPASEFLSKEQ